MAAEGWAQWRMPLFFVAALGAVIATLVWLGRAPAPIATPTTPSAPSSTESTSNAPPAIAIASTPPPPPSVLPAVPPSSTGVVVDAGEGWSYFELPDGALVPLPPGADHVNPIASAIPTELPQTPEWKLEKTQQAMAAVVDRQQRTDDEIAAAEKAGDTDTANAKKVLAHRLQAQIDAMKREIADEQAQIDGGVP